MQLLKKFKCTICGCESADSKDGGRYCQKCKLIYGHNTCLEIAAHDLKNEKHKKTQFKCCKCGYVYSLEGEHPEPFICDRCKAYDEEHRRGTKLRNLPGLPSMTYEHLALLPEYAACMFTKHMTDKELSKLKAIRAKVSPPKKSFTELIDVI